MIKLSKNISKKSFAIKDFTYSHDRVYQKLLGLIFYQRKDTNRVYYIDFSLDEYFQKPNWVSPAFEFGLSCQLEPVFAGLKSNQIIFTRRKPVFDTFWHSF